jgi:GNAT superfamily N-acetyltransferase
MPNRLPRQPPNAPSAAGVTPPAAVVLRFLQSVGRTGDAQFYLRLFQADKERFACLAVDAPVLLDALEAVALDLRFLATLKLFPVVMVGLLSAKNAGAQAEALHGALLRAKVKVQLVRPDYFGSPDDLVHAIRAALRSGAIPVVPLGVGLHACRRSRFALAHHLVVGLRSRKLIHLRRRGGLQLRGKPLPLVNLSRDTASLLRRCAPSEGLSRGQRLLLRAARHLVLKQAKHPCTVALASPLDLMRELFTVKGSGTRLQRLLESAFAQRLNPQFFSQPASGIYLDANYRGAAVVIQTPLGAYLSKFAVDREAQGEGIGSDLWEAVVQAHPILFWRSRRHNPINAWYVQQCDGLQRSGRWTVFWRGFSAQRLADAVAFAQAAPADFC